MITERLNNIKIRRIIIDRLEFNNLKLTELQIDNIVKNILKQSESSSTYKVNSIDSLKIEMEKNYNEISNKRLEYFIKNFSYGVNNTYGHIKDNRYSNGLFKYRECFNYVNKTPDKNNIHNYNLTFTGEKNQGEFLSNQDKIYSYKKISKVMYLDYINIDKSKVFITFTLPAQYHKYRNIKGNFIEKSKLKNNDYTGGNYEINIKNGLIKLNEIHQYFYKTLKHKIMRIKKGIEIDFIKILEPHKSLNGHLHALFYIDEEYLEVIEEVYNMTIEKFNLTQTDYEILEEVKASTYLNKYLLKTTKTENLFYNQYKRYFSNIRFFTSSNFKHTNQSKIDLVYKYLYKHKKNLTIRLKKSNKPIYYQIEQMIINNTFQFEIEEVETLVFDNLKLKENYNNLFNSYSDKLNIQRDKEKQRVLDNKKFQNKINNCYENLEDNDNIIFILDNTDKYFKSFERKNNQSKLIQEDKEEESMILEIKELLSHSINEYFSFRKIKKITSLKRKDIEYYRSKEVVYIPLNKTEIQNLYDNPFENEEIENNCLQNT